MSPGWRQKDEGHDGIESQGADRRCAVPKVTEPVVRISAEACQTLKPQGLSPPPQKITSGSWEQRGFHPRWGGGGCYETEGSKKQPLKSSLGTTVV